MYTPQMPMLDDRAPILDYLECAFDIVERMRREYASHDHELFDAALAAAWDDEIAALDRSYDAWHTFPRHFIPTPYLSLANFHGRDYLVELIRESVDDKMRRLRRAQ